MNPKDILLSRGTSMVIAALAVLLVMILVFQSGYYIGYRKGIFSYEWNDAYFNDPIGPRSIFAPFINDTDDMNPNGAVGRIISIQLPLVLMRGGNNLEKLVSIGPDTIIRATRGMASTSDLRLGDKIVIIGIPTNDGRISASLIKIISPVSTSTAKMAN